MISALTVTDPAATCISWWPKVEWLRGRDRIEFKPGVNILFGPNGSGKSTVLKALARMLMCEQGGKQVVTYDSVRAIFTYEKALQGLAVEHDGNPVAYCNPDSAVGLIGGMAGFDDDFFLEGVLNTTFKGSAGQTTLRRIEESLCYMVDPGKYPIPAVHWKYPKEPRAGDDPAQHQAIHALFAPTPGVGPVGPTVILDEPTKSIALPLEISLWQKLPSLVARSNFQVIVASHSPFCLNLPGVNVIETKTGYLAECQERVRQYFRTA